MFGKKKRIVENITFVQPLKGEVYFCAPIAYSCPTMLRNSEGKEGKQVFTDSDLALAGKLKLIFEREKMSWFEIKEEKSALEDERFFALYYYPHRLVASRALCFDERATLKEIKRIFDFIVTEPQNRLAVVKQTSSPSAYRSIEEQLASAEEEETTEITAEELIEEPEGIPVAASTE